MTQMLQILEFFGAISRLLSAEGIGSSTVSHLKCVYGARGTNGARGSLKGTVGTPP